MEIFKIYKSRAKITMIHHTSNTQFQHLSTPVHFCYIYAPLFLFMNYLMQILDIASIIYEYFDAHKFFIPFLEQVRDDTRKRNKTERLNPELDNLSDFFIAITTNLEVEVQNYKICKASSAIYLPQLEQFNDLSLTFPKGKTNKRKTLPHR